MPDQLRPSPQDYADLFDVDRRGACIIQDLIDRFGGNIYVKGGLEGDRQTCFNAGRRSVLDFILGRINQANGVNTNEE